MAMDEVDRLFECFKCGVSPPSSALRERKRAKRRLRRSSMNEVPIGSSILSSGSAGDRPKSTTDGNLSAEKSESSTVKTNIFSCGKQISPVVFYGSAHGLPPKRLSRLWKLLHEIGVDLSEQNREKLSKDVWATFSRQDDAMKFAKGLYHVRIFSYQDHINGQRRFLVSTYDEFWRRYKDMNAKFRHHYEVIQEGLPCHLYFDLEFNRRANTEKDGDEMTDLLISIILEALKEKYRIHGNQEWVVELDSSTKEKFSRHLIFCVPKTAFKDNSHAGAFVSEVCSQIINAREKDGRLKKLFVMKEANTNESSSQLFVDTAVYSRNRCFRLALSSKAGKNSFLLPTGRFRCKGMDEKDMFMTSLICNTDVDCEKLLVCKMDLECMKTLHFDTEVNQNFGIQYHIPLEISSSAFTHDDPKTYHLGKSPFSSLDKFIESVASIGNISGKIRSWYWFSEYGLIIYNMSRNRYCERIGREHKSNHVMYVIDLRRAAYYQKCHDPDCRGYRSPLRPIPVDFSPDISALFGSLEMVQHGRPTYDIVSNQLSDDQKHVFPCKYEDILDSSVGDSWWDEAIRVADDIENKQKKQTNPEIIDDSDEEWWSAVERTASQTELTLK